jgi:hypothetical protein
MEIFLLCNFSGYPEGISKSYHIAQISWDQCSCMCANKEELSTSLIPYSHCVKFPAILTDAMVVGGGIHKKLRELN